MTPNLLDIRNLQVAFPSPTGWVTAVDTILVAGGLSKAIATLSSSPYNYAQTFTRAAWYISYADNMKHM